MSDWKLAHGASEGRSPAPGIDPPASEAPLKKNEYIRPGLELRTGGRRVAIPLESAREVALEQAPISRIPRTLPPILGAVNLRGRVVALMELAGLLGERPEPRDRSLCRLVLLEGVAVALWVEEVVGICELEGVEWEILSTSWILERVEEMLGPAAGTMDYLGGAGC